MPTNASSRHPLARSPVSCVPSDSTAPLPAWRNVASVPQVCWSPQPFFSKLKSFLCRQFGLSCRHVWQRRGCEHLVVLGCVCRRRGELLPVWLCFQRRRTVPHRAVECRRHCSHQLSAVCAGVLRRDNRCDKCDVQWAVSTWPFWILGRNGVRELQWAVCGRVHLCRGVDHSH